MNLRDVQRTPSGTIMMVFTESYGSYSSGTRAAFTDSEARRLIDRKVARPAGERRAAPVDDANNDIEFETEERAADGPLEQIIGNPDWRDIHGATLISIARKVAPDEPIQNKHDAIDVIEGALEGAQVPDTPETAG